MRYHIDVARRTITAHDRYAPISPNSYATFEGAKTELLKLLKQEHIAYTEAIQSFIEGTKVAKMKLRTLEADIHKINVSDEADWR